MSPPPADPPPPAANRPFFRRRSLWLAVGVVLVGAGVAGYFLWKKSPGLPGPGSPAYEEYVDAFQVGVAAMDVGLVPEAEESLNRTVELVPEEPAGWANRGLLFLRTNRLPQADQDLERARQLAPDDATIQKMLGLLAQRRGKFAEAATYYRQAVAKNPADVEAIYSLARIVNQEQEAGSDAEYQRLMEQILVVQPENRRVLADRLQVAARRSDREAVNDTLKRFRVIAPRWTNDLTRKAFADLEQAATGPLGDAVFPAVITFTNVLMGEAGFVQSAEEVSPTDSQAGQPVRTFLVLQPFHHSPAPPDPDLKLTSEPLAGAPAGRWDLIAPVYLTGEGPPVVLLANATGVQAVGGKVTIPPAPVAPTALVPLDWDNDYLMDLLVVGSGGLRFLRQQPAGTFTDVTAKTGLPESIVHDDYTTALAADYDLDGDIDVLLGRRTGMPVVLRNNSDGTFIGRTPFPGVVEIRAFAWADFDHDGAPDAAMIDGTGKLHVFANERSGVFTPWPVAPPGGGSAMCVADIHGDGVLDLIVTGGGDVFCISTRDKRTAWDVFKIAEGRPVANGGGPVRLFSADLDNNGVPDLLVSSPTASAAWLGSAGGKFEPLAGTLPPRVLAVADLDGTGRLDLLALDAEGRPVRARNTGAKDYHWQSIRFTAEPIKQGDGRVNSFGIGGEIEIRSGTYVLKRPLDAPAVHFGLGTRARADVMRITWPNGQSQFEFKRPVDAPVMAKQRLKGSCPFLFTWDGERFVFVTDIMWSSPLGLYINAQATGGLAQTTEWVKVRGDQLVPRDGYYVARAQANLWETHFFDHLALHVIDHPPDTELFVDERLALEPFKPTAVLTGPPRPVAKATDHLGGDATDVVRAVDAVYLDRCVRGRYQGIANDHWVEVDLGDDGPKDGPVWLIAQGWVHPTDSSINFAIEQGKHVRPRGLVLEVPDGQGGWKAVRDGIGFPAGKNKTILIRLDGLGGPGVPRRFRLRTNMEIFWDSLRTARGLDDSQIVRTELLPVEADLRGRGILEMTEANRSSPELPHYDRVIATGQVWRDLVGFHTRFGDVRELVEKIDDRYAILNAGDEIALKFKAPPGPKPGWKRDFVWVSDGWEKDGDFNTRHGKTVLPLPYHGMPGYEVPPGRLEDDPVYRRHRKDWEVYHTRLVTPAAFERGLRPRK